MKPDLADDRGLNKTLLLGFRPMKLFWNPRSWLTSEPLLQVKLFAY